MQVRGIGAINFKRITKAILTGGASEIKALDPLEKKLDAAGKAVLSKGGKIIAVTSLWPIRASFLELLRLNFRGFSSRIHRMTDTSALKKRWEQLGGNWGDFNAAVNKGWDRPYLFGIKKGEGARSESDQELIQNAEQVFTSQNGVNLSQAVFSTDPGSSPYKITIGEAYTVAALIASAGAAIAAIVPLINLSKNEDTLEKINAGELVSSDDINKLANAEAQKAYSETYNKEIAAGKTVAQATVAATAASVAAKNKTISDIKKIQASTTKPDPGVTVNYGSILKDATPFLLLGGLAFMLKK